MCFFLNLKNHCSELNAYSVYISIQGSQHEVSNSFDSCSKIWLEKKLQSWEQRQWPVKNTYEILCSTFYFSSITIYQSAHLPYWCYIIDSHCFSGTNKLLVFDPEFMKRQQLELGFKFSARINIPQSEMVQRRMDTHIHAHTHIYTYTNKLYNHWVLWQIEYTLIM